MPRTPLFHGAQRAMHIALLANRHGWSTEEAVQQTSARTTRRDFLKASALATLGPSLIACRSNTVRPPSSKPEVVVVGAGLAGLTCAYRLQQAGIHARVFEAQSRLGGRIFSLRNYFDAGQVVELGGEMIDTNHGHIRGLATELGLTLDDLDSTPELARTLWHFGGVRRSDGDVVEAFRPIAAAIERDLARVDEDLGYRNSEAGRDLDQQSLAAWFDAHDVRGWIRSLLDVAYTTEMGLPIDQQSSLNFLTSIDPTPEPFRIFGESDERYHIRGGNDLLASELGKRLTTQIEVGCVLEAISATAAGGLTLTLRTGSGTRDVRASHAVLALPLTALRRVRLDVEIPSLQRRAINELAYGTNAKLIIGFSSRPWRDAQRSDGSTFSDLPYQTTWEASRAQAGVSGVLTNYVGGLRGLSIATGTAAEQARAAVAELETIFPGVAQCRTGMKEARFHWPSHEWTLGSYMCPRPGDWTTFGGVFEKPAGRLYFAGEHSSSTAQGFMEGACESGDRAAADLLQHVGSPAHR